MLEYNNIKMIIMDVDGTLTDGGIYYDSIGNELKKFDVKDGLAIKVGIAAGLVFAVITGRKSQIVERRIRELGIQHLMSGVQVKLPAMIKILEELKILPNEVCYIGDDLNDLECMEYVGCAICPADAAKEVQSICDYISPCNSGAGAVRNGIEHILTEQGKWNEYYRKLYFQGCG